MKEKTTYSSKDIIEIGRRVREQRTFDGLSQRELADSIQVEKNVIQRIESGKLKAPNKEVLMKIAYSLQRNPKYFLLTSNTPRSEKYDTPWHYAMPEFQHTVESFIYSHSSLRADIQYMSKYMHPDFQQEIIGLIHTIVTFHKCGVFYPNTTPKEAAAFNHKRIDDQIKENFLESIRKTL